MSTDLEDRLGAALRARAAQLSADPDRLDPSSVTARTAASRHGRAWLAVAASVVTVALVAAGMLVLGRNDSTRPAAPPATPPATTVATGTITGLLHMVGGVLSTDIHVRGTITATRHDTASTLRIDVKTDAGGRFTMNLPPGTYQVTGKTPQYMINDAEGVCRGGSVTVATGGRERVDVTCQMK